MSDNTVDKAVQQNVVALEPTMSKSEMSGYYSDVLQRLSKTRRRPDFILLFQHFAPRVKSYILRLGLTDSVAEELAQETMLTMWRRAETYCRHKAAASTWIFTLARNISIDWMRKQKYPTSGDSEVDIDAENSIEHHKMSTEVITSRMSEQLENLPEEQRQVIFMSYFEGRAHSEIAQRLGIPLGSVKSRMRLAFNKLKSAWGENED